MQTVDRKTLTFDGGARLATLPFPEVEENEAPTGDPATLAATAKGLSETYDEQAYYDTRLRGDINSIKGYCNRENAVVVAVADGDWSSGSTWYNTDSDTQVKPVAGDTILIPEGITVTYDQNDDTEYGTVRVDGEMAFKTDRDTKIVLDTFFIDHTGTLRIGSEGSPLPANRNCTIEYADNGDLDVTNDPVKMQRGLVCLGQALIYGAPKQAFRRLTTGLAASATSCTLDGSVDGWKVGDEILITGTRMKGFDGGKNGTWRDVENETRTIASIGGTTNSPVITWTGGLAHDHPACHRRAALTPHMLNLTRNIKTYTAGTDTPSKHRAHQLFKNKDANYVGYVEARNMGRTDMQRRLGAEGKPENLRLIMENMMIVPSTGQPIDADTNTNGRYMWHFHRNGADNPDLDPTIFEGLVGVECPSWMYVHHDSHGHMRNCIAVDFVVGFAGEGGGTWGSFDGCFATGSKQPAEEMTQNNTKNGGNNLGDIGHGFWSNSRILNIKNCIATGCQNGMAWTSRVSFKTDVFATMTAIPRAFYGNVGYEHKAFSVIEGFKDNEVYACLFGGSVAKKQPVQHHNLRSVLDGFTAWEVSKGFHWQYTHGYTMIDWDIIGFDPTHRTGTPWNPGSAFDIYRQTSDMVLVRPKVEAMKRAFRYTHSSGENFETNMHHVVISPETTDVDEIYSTNGGNGRSAEVFTPPWSALDNGVIDVAEYDYGDLTIVAEGGITPDHPEDECTWAGGGDNFVIANNFKFTDSLGERRRYSGRPNVSFGVGDRIEGQTEAAGAKKVTKDWGIHVLLDKDQMHGLMRQEGVYTSAAGDMVLLIPDQAGDRVHGLETFFFLAVALRMSSSEFYSVLPNFDAGGSENGNNGPLLNNHTDLSGIVQDFTSFNPAGNPGLT